MKKFKKGAVTTVVEDNDRRIQGYIANGWKEVSLDEKPKSEADKRTEQAKSEATASEKGKKGKTAQIDKKVNEAIDATETAHEESEPVDDGLFDKGGE